MSQECCHDESDALHAHEEHDHDHGTETSGWQQWLPPGISAVFLLVGLALDYFNFTWFDVPFFRLLWYLAAYLPVGWPVWRQALNTMRKGEVFSEFFLMGIATAGAFYLGQYAEGVAVMLFYAVGEAFQHAAVHRAKRGISALLDVRPAQVNVLRDGHFVATKPAAVAIGETIRLRPGERAALDSILLGATEAAFDTAALTGESLPRIVQPGDTVLAGSIALDRLVELRSTRPYGESTLARILHLVQHATQRKAQTEQFIRRFARIYTPIVCGLAALIVALPAFFAKPYVFDQWLYRALVFLVISCPCALVISIPLGYFGGIGAASRHGILFKGSNFLDLMTRLNTLVTDKTGTLTEGVFAVRDFRVVENGFSEKEILQWTASLESASNHPVARALLRFAENQNTTLAKPQNVEELSGLGLKGLVGGKALLVGNQKLMDRFGVNGFTPPPSDAGALQVLVAVDGHIAGFFEASDALKPDAPAAIRRLRQLGIRQIVMLSGDRPDIVGSIGKELELDAAYGALLPEEKVQKIEALRLDPTVRLAFAGDGLNDAPALALADVGIAMGGLGSDAAIETADVVIQTDQPSKIATAIDIAQATRRVVWQNIGLAFAVKALVLALGAGGLATMWEAVIADVGVALLAILNAVRIQRMRFE